MPALIWQVATVVEAQDELLRVSFDSLTTCQRCLQGQGCGAGAFSRLFARRQASLVVRCEHDFAIGDRLRVGVSGSGLVLSALALYGLPLLGFLVGALIGHVLAGDMAGRDFIALMSGLMSGLAAFGLFRLGPGLRLRPRIERLSCTKADSALESDAK
ncbi:MAG: SoxR reducing system RseC family protein [Wenzhouxiangella sp.]